MNIPRRRIFKIMALMTIGKLFSTNTMAKKWNASAFDADTMAKSLLLINAEDLIETEKIKLKTPQIAENGAIVPLEITSGLKDTAAVHILVEKNPLAEPEIKFICLILFNATVLMTDFCVSKI